MRIYYLSNSTVPSSKANSVHVMKMCNAFSKIGHDVVLFAYQRDAGSDVFDQYDVDAAFEIQPIPASTLPGARRLLRTFAASRLSRRRPRPDVFYARDLYSLIAVRSLRAPLIFEAHTPPRSWMEKRLMGRLFATEHFLRLVVISGALAETYASLYPRLEEGRLLVAHDGADDLRAAPHHGHTLTWPGRGDTLQLGYVGSLLPGKGAERVAELARRLPEYDFHIIGGEEPAIEQIRESFQGSNLFLHGQVDHALVPDFLRHLDIGLLPSQRRVIVESGADIAAWMSPLKLFEYMAARLSIIASDLPVIREVLTHERNSLLAPPEDLDGWIAAVRRLADDQLFRSEIAERAYGDFASSYSWKKRSEHVLKGVPLGDRHA